MYSTNLFGGSGFFLFLSLSASFSEELFNCHHSLFEPNIHSSNRNVLKSFGRFNWKIKIVSKPDLNYWMNMNSIEYFRTPRVYGIEHCNYHKSIIVIANNEIKKAIILIPMHKYVHRILNRYSFSWLSFKRRKKNKIY